MKILIVEDNPINQRVVEAIFKRNSIQYNVANDGEEALLQLKKDKYDLILMDCQMPALDGYQTTRIIRKNEAAQNESRCPIIALTANAMAGDREKCLEAGMDDFIAKPFKSAEMIRIIEKWTKSA